MIKQISIAAVAVAAITGIAYLAYDRLTRDKDEAEAEEDPRKELRSVLNSIEVTMDTAQGVAKRFVEDLPSEIKDTEKVKAVTFIMGVALDSADEKVKEFLAGSYEYPFDELSDEEVLDVLAQAREQDVLVGDVLKEVRNVVTATYFSEAA